MSDFDAIVVGSGLAGSCAAIELAREGKNVLVVERGNYSGAKNMTGGRIYAHSLHKVFPDNFDEIPFERKVTRERISLMSPDSNFTIEFTSDQLDQEGSESYTVLRSGFDQWMQEQAEDAGAEYINGIAVEKLMKDDNGRVIGIMAGEDEITADVVLLCDGVNSLLTQQAVGFQRPSAKQMAVGIKDVFELPEKTINDRFGVTSDEGTAWLFAGDVTHGVFGGGIIYVNKESLSVGIVAGIDAVATQAKRPIYQMLQDFEDRDDIKPYLEGAKRVEHSGHMVPEGGLNMMPDLTTDGCLIAGDAAMMCINFGYTVRGMDYAVEAGRLAGIEAAKALDNGDTSKAGLAGYEKALEDSFVMKDLRGFSAEPEFMENFDHMFKGYPEMVRDIMNKVFVVNGPAPHMKPAIKPIIKEMGYMTLFKDVKGAMKAL
jgi:electron transfer flavoprotein-quinone oxidoreductase